MHLFLLDADYKATKQYDYGYLMQYSDNTDIVFFAIDGATETKPSSQVAALSGNLSASSEKLMVMMNWDSFVFQRKTLWGWSAAIPSTFTQIAGSLALNGIITDNVTGVIAFTTTISLTVNPASSDVPWNEAMNYAQWKELVSYFFNPAAVVTLDTEQTITGEKTFEGGLKVESGGTAATISADGIQTGDNTYTFPVKEAGAYVFATTADVGSALQEAKEYTDEAIGGVDLSSCAKLSQANTFSEDNVFEKSIKANVLQSDTLKNSDGSVTGLAINDVSVNVGNSGKPLKLYGSQAHPTYTTADGTTKDLAFGDEVPSNVAVKDQANEFTEINTFDANTRFSGNIETYTYPSFQVHPTGGFDSASRYFAIRGGYANEFVEYDLNDFATTSDLSSYAKTSDLSAYETKNELDTTLTGYAKLSADENKFLGNVVLSKTSGGLEYKLTATNEKLAFQSGNTSTAVYGTTGITYYNNLLKFPSDAVGTFATQEWTSSLLPTTITSAEVVAICDNILG